MYDISIEKNYSHFVLISTYYDSRIRRDVGEDHQDYASMHSRIVLFHSLHKFGQAIKLSKIRFNRIITQILSNKNYDKEG